MDTWNLPLSARYVLSHVSNAHTAGSPQCFHSKRVALAGFCLWGWESYPTTPIFWWFSLASSHYALQGYHHCTETAAHHIWSACSTLTRLHDPTQGDTGYQCACHAMPSSCLKSTHFRCAQIEAILGSSKKSPFQISKNGTQVSTAQLSSMHFHNLSSWKFSIADSAPLRDHTRIFCSTLSRLKHDHNLSKPSIVFTNKQINLFVIIQHDAKHEAYQQDALHIQASRCSLSEDLSQSSIHERTQQSLFDLMQGIGRRWCVYSWEAKHEADVPGQNRQIVPWKTCMLHAQLHIRITLCDEVTGFHDLSHRQ